MALCTAYSKLPDSLSSGLVAFGSDSFKVMLLASYSVGTTVDDAQFVDDVLAAAAQTVGSPYVAGGLALTGVTWTQDGGTWTLDCDDPTWPSGSISAAFALFYDSTPGSTATDPVVGYWDFGGTVTLDPFLLTINDSGLLTFGSS